MAGAPGDDSGVRGLAAARERADRGPSGGRSEGPEEAPEPDGAQGEARGTARRREAAERGPDPGRARVASEVRGSSNEAGAAAVALADAGRRGVAERGTGGRRVGQGGPADRRRRAERAGLAVGGSGEAGLRPGSARALAGASRSGRGERGEAFWHPRHGGVGAVQAGSFRQGVVGGAHGAVGAGRRRAEVVGSGSGEGRGFVARGRGAEAPRGARRARGGSRDAHDARERTPDLRVRRS